tara:strand:- start:945 stop:1982 length:1038 start_codon:yes stop_codon:yes gene_type:complete
MRVAQIMLSSEFGGAERSFTDISVCLKQLGHEVLAIGSKRSKALDKLQSSGVKTKRVSCYGSWDFFTTKSLKKILSQFKPDIVHCHLARASNLGGSAAKDLEIMVVAKTHNLVNPKYYKNINIIVVTTEAQRRHLEAEGVSSHRLRKIPNFSSVKSGPLKKPLSEKDGLLRVAALGRFVKKKGFDTLLEAYASLSKEEFNVKLKIGGDGPERKALKKLAVDLDIYKGVEFTGWVENVAEFLKGSDLFVLPSREEPFGIVILEAMAAGIPIVTTKTQGPLEILDKKMAHFTEAGNANKMAKDIKAALRSNHRNKFAELSKQRFDTLYTSEKVTGQYLNLYKDLLGK